MKGKKCSKCGRNTLHSIYQRFFGEAINYYKWIDECSNCGHVEGMKEGEYRI